MQEQQELADQLVREKQQRADAEVDLQKRLQRERDNREKMAVAAAASKVCMHACLNLRARAYTWTSIGVHGCTVHGFARA